MFANGMLGPMYAKDSLGGPKQRFWSCEQPDQRLPGTSESESMYILCG